MPRRRPQARGPGREARFGEHQLSFSPLSTFHSSAARRAVETGLASQPIVAAARRHPSSCGTASAVSRLDRKEKIFSRTDFSVDGIGQGRKRRFGVAADGEVHRAEALQVLVVRLHHMLAQRDVDQLHVGLREPAVLVVRIADGVQLAPGIATSRNSTTSASRTSARASIVRLR